MIKKIRESISAKIILTLLIISVSVIAVSYILIRNRSIEYMMQYYQRIGDIITAYSERCVTEYFDSGDHDFSGMEHLEDVFFKLCDDNVVDMAYVIVKNEDPGLGSVLMLVTREEKYFVGEAQEFKTYPLEQYEKKVFDGKEDSAVGQYDSRYGDVVAFCRAFEYFDEEEGNSIRVLVGLNVKKSAISSTAGKIMLKQLGVIGVLFVLFVVIIGVSLREMVIKPITIASKNMNSFIENDKLLYEKLTVKGNDEIARTSRVFNSMAEEIKGYIQKVRDYEGERQRVLAEINIAAQIQVGLLPKTAYTKDPFIARGFMRPARNVGGDFYFYERMDENRLAFAIGDVSGKGMSAAMFMASVTAAIKYNLRIHETPAGVLEAVNKDITKENPEQLFVTIFVGIIDADKKILTYSNAGHNPPFIVGKELKELSEAKGVLAGLFDDEEYENCSIEISSDDMIFLYTDGVTEAVNDSGQFFGKERLKEILYRRNDSLIQAVLDGLENFTNGASQNDDITMFVAKMKNDTEIVLSAKPSSIKELKAFIMSNNSIEEGFKKKLYLVCEEIFVNIYSYGYPDGNTGTVKINLLVSENCVTISFVDDAVKYNPLETVTDVNEYDLDIEIGGLGKVMAFTIMDETSYEYSEGRNILTMKKYLQEE